MVEHQFHFGRKFYQAKKNWYWYSTTAPRIFAHRWVWKNHYGEIPKGYHIHHKDGNKSNNSIDNLGMLSASQHTSMHGQEVINDPVKLKRLKENCDEIRPLTKEWHASKEGHLWHRYHAEKMQLGKWEPREYECQCCGKKYMSTKRSRARFCTNACKSQWRRDQGLDNTERECTLCKNKFQINKYAKSITCGKSCGAKLRWIERKYKNGMD